MKASRLILGLLLALVGLNLAVGIVAYRFLARLEENYTQLLEQGIPFLNAMQTAATQSARTYAVLIDLSQANTPAQVAVLETELASVRGVSDEIFSAPETIGAVPPQMRAAYDEIRALRVLNRDLREEFLKLVRAGNLPAASAYLRSTVSPAQRTYISKLELFCDVYQDSIAFLRNDLATANASDRSLLFGLGAAPLAIVLGLALLFAAATALIYLLYLRRPSASGGPSHLM